MKRITDQDMFGHTINLNFNRQGHTYKTCMGGCCSIVVNVTMFIYVMINLRKLLLKEDGNNTILESLMDFSQMEPINYSDTELLIFWNIKKQTSN